MKKYFIWAVALFFAYLLFKFIGVIIALVIVAFLATVIYFALDKWIDNNLN